MLNDLLFILPIMLIGAVSGFASATPIGPINLWVADATLAGRRKTMIWFLAGVIIADLAYAMIAVFGYFTLFSGSTLAQVLGILGGIALMGLGIYSFREQRQLTDRPMSFPKADNFHSLQYFVSGFMICGANPAFLMFWVFISNLLSDHLIDHLSIVTLSGFLVGIATGDVLWFRLFSYLVKRGVNFLKPKTLRPLRVVIAFAFILMGALSIFQTLDLEAQGIHLKKTNKTKVNGLNP